MKSLLPLPGKNLKLPLGLIGNPRFQNPLPGAVQAAELPHPGGGHVGVAADLCSGEALPLPGKNLKLPLGLIGNPYLPHSPQAVQLQEAQKGEPFLISQQEALSSPYSFAGQDAGYAPPQSRRRHVLLDHGQQGQSSR